MPGLDVIFAFSYCSDAKLPGNDCPETVTKCYISFHVIFTFLVTCFFTKGIKFLGNIDTEIFAD